MSATEREDSPSEDAPSEDDPFEGGATPIIALSHLRWGFVYQRPHHLMSRAAADREVFYVEEPVFGSGVPLLQERLTPEGVIVCLPRLPVGITPRAAELAIASLVADLVVRHGLSEYVLWYETPMFGRHMESLDPVASVYDCMDELAAFAGAPTELVDREAELLSRVDLVFTGGHSLFTRKQHLHPSVHPFPSSVDARHFGRARMHVEEPEDQARLRRPRLGYFGVVDERMDLSLVDCVAAARPEWELIILGPVLKIDPAGLPRRVNLHYIGERSYEELPAYVGGWDVAMMPFARNDATRYISPTKTLEYLAAGRPVVSTSIHDVVHPYGDEGLVSIADSPEAFAAAADRALREEHTRRLTAVDALLADTSWDRTWSEMNGLLDLAIRSRGASHVPVGAAT